LDDLFRLSRNFYTAPKGATVATRSGGVPPQDVSVADGISRISEFSRIRWRTFQHISIFAQNELNTPTLNLDTTKLQTIQKVASEIADLVFPTQSKASNCAKQIALVEESLIDYSALNLGLAATARGDFMGIAITDRVNIAEILAIAAPGTEAPAGSNVGIRFTGGLQNLKEQCIFLSQIFHLVDHHKKEELKRAVEGTVIYPYAGSREESNASLTIEGEPFGFINQLTQYPTTANFFDATNAQLAHLQPMMRFFKVTPSNSTDGSVEKSYEFKFDTFASQQDIQEVFTNRNKRGFGAGIKSFNFTYDGSNPFSIKKSIKATLTIYANNFSELIKERGSIRYIDLALKTGTAIRERTGDPELDFRIKAVVGLAVPNGNTTANFTDIMNAVKENYVTLNLTPVTHTFDFDETGAVTFKVEYYAYIEEFLDKARMNIFADNVLSKRVTERRLAYRTARQRCKEQDDAQKLSEILDLDSQNIEFDKKESLKFLTTQLQKRNLIYFLSFSNEQLEELTRRGPFYLNEIKGQIVDPTSTGLSAIEIATDLDSQWTAYSEQASDLSTSSGLDVSFRLSALSGNQYAFFYLGDLLNTILSLIPQNLQGLQGLSEQYQPQGSQTSTAIPIDSELIEKEERLLRVTYEKFKKFRFILGPIEIVNQANKTDIRKVSLADIPISLAYFNEWLTSKLLAKEEAEYPLTQFLNDLINNFIKNYLNDDTCFSYDIKQKVRLFQNCITSYGDEENDNITNHLIEKGETRLALSLDQHDDLPRPILQPAGPRNFNVCQYGPDREYHFFVYYAGRVQPIELMTGDRCEDEKRGLFHYVLGKDRGIVKSIQLQKDETPGLKEVRFEKEGFDGLRQLREIYNVKVDSVANVSTFPGTYIFVDPRGFSPNLGSYDINEFDLTDLGIGGYYMIINSTHEFAAGTMNTSFNARWVQSLDSSNPQDEQEGQTTSGDSEPKKCLVEI
jgi:hypothetical protein